jgi:prevent-host-death family protein
MPYTTHIQPISYLKANAVQVLRNLAINQRPLLITQNGEAAAVLQDVQSFEKNQEMMALLKILALGNAQIEKGQVTSATKAFAEVRRHNKAAACGNMQCLLRTMLKLTYKTSTITLPNMTRTC